MVSNEGWRYNHVKTQSGKNASHYDLYTEPNGDIVVKPKGGTGIGTPTGYNVNEL